MKNYASVTVEGFIVKDLELNKTKSDKSVVHFTIAVNHYSRDKDNPKVSFIDIDAWNNLAKQCHEHCGKGSRVMVIGELRQDRWEGQDGKMRSKVKVVASDVRFLSVKAPAHKVKSA